MNTKNKIDKNHLINIIEDILLSDGLSGLSIRKVATKANISIGGVQYIFGNKEGMIKAVLEKNEEDYNRQIKILLKDDNSKYSQLKAHIEYISKHNDNEEFDKISKIITILLQEKFVYEGLQDWYSTSLNSIDTNIKLNNMVNGITIYDMSVAFHDGSKTLYNFRMANPKSRLKI